MKYSLTCFISALVLASCSASRNESRANSISFADLNSKCKIGYNLSGCNALHNTPIKIEGILSSLSESQFVIHPDNINEYDYENNEHWFSSIQIMGTIDERKNLKKFENKHVIAQGLIHTSCVKTHTDLDALNKKALESENDEIFLHMATGTCHYVNNRAFFAPKIIIKDE